MGKYLKLLLSLTLLLVVVIVVTVVGAVMYFDPNQHKDFIVSRVEKATGRSFAITGNIELTYYPWLGLEAEGITLGNAKGFGDQPLVHADLVALRIKTMPLFKKHYELDTLRLHGLEINLAKNKEGVTNWQDMMGKQPKKQKQINLPFAAVILGGVDVQDAKLNWRDETINQTVKISDMNIKTGELTYGAPINLDVGMKVESNKPALKSDLKLNGTLNYNLDTEIYSFKPINLIANLTGPNVPGGAADLLFKAAIESNLKEDTAHISDLSLDVLGTSIKGELTATDIKSGEPQAKGQLKIQGKDLAQLLKVLEIPSADDLAKQPDRSFYIQTGLQADIAKDTVMIPDLDARIMGTQLKGQIEINKVRSVAPAVKTRLETKGDDLLWIAQLAGQKKPAQALSEIKDRSFNIKLNADADLDSGKVNIPDLNATLLGTVIKAQLNGEKIQSNTPAVNGKIDAKGTDLATLFKVAGIEPLASQLAGLGDRSFDIKTTLDADLEKGNVKITNLDARLLGASINGNINASKIQTSKPAAKGMLKATGPDLPALLQVIGQFEAGEKPKLKEYGKRLSRADDKSFDIATTFDADLGSGDIDIPDLAVKTLGITAKGQLHSKNITSSKGKVDGRFSLQGEKLSSVLAAFGQDGLGEVLQNININTGIKGEGGEISLSPLQVKATFAGKQIPNSPVDMTLSANTRANMDKQTLVVENMSLQGLGLNLKSNIKAEQIKDNPTYSGDLSVAEFNLRKFAEQMNQTLPKTADKKVFTKVALKTGFSGSTDSISLKDFFLQLDETQVRGKLSVNKFSQPDIQFGVGIDSINADRYLPPAAKGKPVTPETVAGGAVSELPLDTLRSLRINGDLLIGQLVISNATMTNVKLSIKARDGDIHLEPVAAELYQGKYQGNVALDAKGKVPNLVINTQLEGVQLEPLLKDYMQQPESPLVGVANINLKSLTAHGSNATQIKHTLKGKGSFSVKDGILRGVDVHKALEQLEIMIESKRFGKLDSTGDTKFQQLDGTLDIKNGVVTNHDMLMLASGFNVRGKGMLANLNDETIKYDMMVKVDESRTSRGKKNYNIGGYELPVRCRGNLSKPDCLPDAGDIIKVVLKNTAGDELKKIIGIDSKKQSAPAEATTNTAPATTEGQQTTTTTSKKKKKKAKSPEDVLKEGAKDLLKGIFD